ncbi:hypothetical protein PWYN_22565 [Paenibacillus wynnii]|uniref:Uncharacterized protein n=1 Tax=Paenibacillus wynnii TaxID=268407 RepID=A0A098M4B5_9BACL|nr:hypothetical protein PWYN_22565 [Paenibacillus wynnii]
MQQTKVNLLLFKYKPLKTNSKQTKTTLFIFILVDNTDLSGYDEIENIADDESLWTTYFLKINRRLVYS